MAELSGHRIFLLIISLAQCLESTQLLAHLKKCGDLECETLISRVVAMRDYTGPDCRYLNFTEGEEISVYVKLAGKREDLWAGSKGKDFGFFPRDAVQIEEVFISEEVEISTKESDFLCLFEEGYIFGSEDNELNSNNDKDVHPYEENGEQTYNIYDNDLQREPGFDATSQSILFEDQFSAAEAPNRMRGASESKGREEGETGDGTQEVDAVLPSLRIPEVSGWFGLRREQVEEKAFEPVTQPLKESSFQSRKLVVEDENDQGKISNGEPQTEHKQGLKSESCSEISVFSSVPEDPLELGSESEYISKPQTSGWLGGGFTNYLGFREEDTGLELLSTESNPPLPDVPTALPPAEEALVPCTEAPPETQSLLPEDTIINDSSPLNPGWFDFGFGILGFAYASGDEVTSDDGKNEGDLTASEFDPEKEHETKMVTIMELEDEIIDKEVEERDDSDSTAYLKKFFYNFNNPWSFQNIPEETELQFSRQIPDQNNIAENDETEKLSVKNPMDYMEDPMMSANRYSQSDMASKMKIHEEINLKTSSSKSDDETSKSSAGSAGPALEDSDGSVESALTDSWMVSQNQIPQKENATDFHILKCLFQIDACGFMAAAFSPIIILMEMVVAVLPEDMRSGLSPSVFSWELVTCVVGLLAVLLFLWRGYRSIRSRFYVGREKKLALELSVLIEEKCKLLEKVSLVQKEYEGLASSLKDASFEKESTEAQSLEAVYKKLQRSKSNLEDEILVLEKELQEEKSKNSEQDELMADISKRIQSLEDELKSLKTQVAEAKTTFRIFQINEERLKGAMKNVLNENSQLQESQKQLLQEAERMEEQVSELSKQKITFEESKAHAEQVLKDRENHVKSLIKRLLKMKDWVTVLGEDITDDGNLELEMKSESEHDAHLENQPGGALKKLIYAAKLNASLKTLEGERNQIYTQLSEVDKTKEDLTEHIESLQAEQASLQLENAQFESENQKLEQKLKVMTELYQENEMKLHRKLTVEENYRLEKEEKLCKVDEKISHAHEELEIYRKRAKDLEEELERTIHSYQGQIISHEKKAHDNWLAARTAERNLNDLRKENAHNRQKLTDTEFKYELLEKDPYALDVPNTGFGREHSPYGPSPLGRPSSETRAFLSPPTLLEGPLRLSPLLPGGGGRGSRGPENPLDHQISNERGDSSYDRLSDPHRALSDTGSLSPPWDQDRRMMVPPLDGPISSEMESNRNDTKDDLGNSNVPDSSQPAEREAPGPSFVPPPFPPVRDPFFPMDPRSQFMRRGPPFPPPPPGNMYGVSRDYFPPRDFPGPPPPPFQMRSVNAPRGFPHYLPPRAGFFPPPPPSHSERRNEFPSESIPPSNASAAEPSEPQET
uniref:melanoma inhibitory activity protein 2 isoform X3 n=1 Tax=Jaculus jaculus TaxID=51337 RepID=UPI001E1B0757|nr:melanoma inhibitory activity protein 2 isoform X3 [Jaculus jaculus]